jgi:hypothetical protein
LNVMIRYIAGGRWRADPGPYLKDVVADA